jgi:ribonuclease P protein component
MTVFYLPQTVGAAGSASPRIGFTVGRVLGGAVERNRIKRRMREAVRRQRSIMKVPVDVVINPRKSILALEFPLVLVEVGCAFETIEKKLATK